MKLFILIVALFALSSALSENIKAITGCWILAIHDNSRSKTFNHLVESVSQKTKIQDLDVIKRNIQIYMIKACYPIISANDTQQIIDLFEQGQDPHVQFRDIVKNFDYTKYLRDLKDQTTIKNQALDETIMMIVRTLESEFAIPTEQSPRVGVFGQNLNYLLIISVIAGLGLVVFIFKVLKQSDNKQKKQ